MTSIKPAHHIPVLLFGAICLAGWVPSPAQEVFSPPPARLLTRISFAQLTGGVVLLTAAIDNRRDSLHFILDTGSGGISLDSSTVEKLNIETVASDRTIRGIAGIKTVRFANNHTLHFQGLSVDSLNFHINDYDILSGVYGVKIDGIIGYSLLRQFLVGIDYETNTLAIYSPGDFKYPKGGWIMRPAIAGLPMQYAYVGDARTVLARFFIDTGAGLNLLLNNEFLKDSSLLGSRVRRYPTVAEGLGGKTTMDMALLKSFRLGPFKFRNIPVYLFDDDFGVTSYPNLAGLVGNDLLRRFNVFINYPRSEIYLVRNAFFRDPFDYSYTGLGLFQVGADVLVSDVIAGSPAEKAGLQVGDRLLAAGNVLSGNIQAYRVAMQQTGTKLTMIVSRDNRIVETKISIGSLKWRRKS
jgi:hypothetical protein